MTALEFSIRENQKLAWDFYTIAVLGAALGSIVGMFHIISLDLLVISCGGIAMFASHLHRSPELRREFGI